MCDCIERLRAKAFEYEALAREWHDEYDPAALAALGFTTAADYLEENTP